MLSLTAFNMIKTGAETNTRVFTPQKIVKEMLDALPPEVWNSKTTFLDPAVKSGVYLVEIYNRLMETPELIKDFPDEQDRAIHIYKNQLFGIAIDNFCCLMAQRNLYGHIGGESNIRFIDGYMSKVKDKDSKKYIDAVKKEFGEMKFGVIIGNPPYQESTGDGARAKPIYGKFFEKAVVLNPQIISYITPLRWCSADDKLSEFMRKRILTSQCVKIQNYSDSEDVFQNATISGGVGYFIIDANHNGETVIIENGVQSKHIFSNEKIFISSNVGRKIVSKISTEKTLDESIKIDSGFFGLETNEYGYAKKYDIFVRSSKAVGYLELHDIPKNQNEVSKYKVITGAMRNTGSMIINVPEILKPNEVCTSTYTVLEVFNTLEEAQNFVTYVKTKVFRFLISVTLNGQRVTKKNYQLIPMQDFSHPWTDEMLYKKYNLTDEEIDYIEKTIKPMT